MALYLVSRPSGALGSPTQDGCDAMLIVAANSTDAKAMAKAALGADVNDAWTNATVTDITSMTKTFEGFRFVVNIIDTNGNVVASADITATALETIDDIGAALSTAINLASGSYNSTTQVVLFAASSNGYGAHRIDAKVYAPEGPDFPIPGFIASKVDNGSASAALSLTLCADAYVLPGLIQKLAMK